MKTLLKKATLAIAIIVLIIGGLFIVNINIDATDIPPPCEQQIKSECFPTWTKTDLSELKPDPRCTMDAAEPVINP